MVRVWHISPRHLDNNRVLGEHYELHVLLGAIAKYHKGKKGAWVNHPETKKYRNHVKYIVKRHKMITNEMKRMGWNHKTPLNITSIPCSALKNYKPTKSDLKKDITDLKHRLRKEGKIEWLKNINKIYV